MMNDRGEKNKQERGVQEKVSAFFSAHPQEPWTVYDVADTIDVNERLVAREIQELVRKGRLRDEGTLWGNPPYVAFTHFYSVWQGRSSGE